MRRFIRGRGGALAAGLLVGALLATGFMAYRADEFPFVRQDVCWGSLSSDVVDGLVPGDDVRVSELPLAREWRSTGQERGVCRIQRYEDGRVERELTVEVRGLDHRGRDARDWPREFLSPRMAPLGEDIVGMASDDLAWAAFPKACDGGVGPPTVVSLSNGMGDDLGFPVVKKGRAVRAEMARALIRVTNGVMAKLGCDAAYPEPGKLTGLADGGENDPQPAVPCARYGVRLPQQGFDKKERRGRPPAPKSAPAFSCAAWHEKATRPIRFTTITNPRLVELFESSEIGGAIRLRGDGYGSSYGNWAVYEAECPGGPVAFLAGTGRSYLESPVIPDLFPAYVKSEAKRIGCGDVRMTMQKVVD